MMVEGVRPYIMDLGSVNGTFVNNERIEGERYYELLERVNLTILCGSCRPDPECVCFDTCVIGSLSCCCSCFASSANGVSV
jgi:FHA domain